MRKKVGELFKDVFPDSAIPSGARLVFTFARNDAITLLEIHDQITGNKAGRPKPELEAIKRSALILTVTAWETFIEDTLTQDLFDLLYRTSDPTTISRPSMLLRLSGSIRLGAATGNRLI
jgi:hypothetical protein